MSAPNPPPSQRLREIYARRPVSSVGHPLFGGYLFPRCALPRLDCQPMPGRAILIPGKQGQFPRQSIRINCWAWRRR